MKLILKRRKVCDKKDKNLETGRRSEMIKPYGASFSANKQTSEWCGTEHRRESATSVQGSATAWKPRGRLYVRSTTVEARGRDSAWSLQFDPFADPCTHARRRETERDRDPALHAFGLVSACGPSPRNWRLVGMGSVAHPFCALSSSGGLFSGLRNAHISTWKRTRWIERVVQQRFPCLLEQRGIRSLQYASRSAICTNCFARISPCLCLVRGITVHVVRECSLHASVEDKTEKYEGPSRECRSWW